MKLVPANKQFFEVKWCKRMVEPGQPLRHAIVIGVFCFKGELLVAMQYLSETWNRPPGNATVGRRQIGDRDEYDASDEHVSAGRMTVDEQGSLRLVRRGTTVTASYRSSDDGPWTALSTQLTSRFDATFQIFLFSGGNDPFGGKKVRVGVDNFHLSASTLVCG